MHRENHSPLYPPSTASANGYSTTTQVKTKKKKNKATNFFLCFRSFDVVGSEPGRPLRNVFTYVAAGDKEGGVFPKVVPVSSSSSSLATSDNEGEDENCRSTQQEKKGRCGFSQVLKAVLFKTKLVKRIQKRKFEKNFANTTNESSITSTSNHDWSEEDVPKVFSKKNSYAGVEEKGGVVFPKVSPMASPLLGNEENHEKRDSQYWISKGRRKLSRVLKAVLFETSSTKKIQKRKKGNKLGRNEISKYNSEEDDPRAMSGTASSSTNCSVFTSPSINSSSSSLSQTSNSSISSLSKRIKSLRSSRNFKANLRYLSDKFRSTSTSTSSKANSRSNSAKNKSFEANTNASKEGQGQQDQDVTRTEKNKYKKGCYRSVVSLCFLLMGLLGLIFYGKMCAVLCTSVWLFSVPLWCTSVGGHGSTNTIDKKKFIIGGLLPRNTRIIHRQ